jgi:nitrate/TMAO reductase-like tetraheme cytochrome c subunit
MNDLLTVLHSLRPGSEWVIYGSQYSGIKWLDENQTQPTEEECVQKAVELEYQEEVNEYQRQRAAEYPSYANQFDKIFHEGVDAWKADIQAIKDKYPKATMDADVLKERQDKAVADMTPAEEAPEETPEEESPAEEE